MFTPCTVTGLSLPWGGVLTNNSVVQKRIYSTCMSHNFHTCMLIYTYVWHNCKLIQLTNWWQYMYVTWNFPLKQKCYLAVDLKVVATSPSILDKINRTFGPHILPILMMPEWHVFAPLHLHHCFGVGGRA